MLDDTVYHVGAEAKLYSVEYNSTALTVKETVKKGQILIVKHADDGQTGIETPETGATFQIYPEGQSYDTSRPTERDILIIDENGFALSKNSLIAFTVFIKQVDGPEKNMLPTFLFLFQ